MDDLIKKLEQATEGSRELDALIMAITREVPLGADQWLREWDGRIDVYQQTKVAAFHASGAVSCYWDPRKYSTSLDAALTLSNGLDELCVEMAIYSDEKTVASCCWGPTEPCARQSTEAEAPTPALALCIASLRARQAMKDAA